MMFSVAAGCLALAVPAAGYLSGRRRWRWYPIPGAILFLYATALGYVLVYTATCTDCRGYQSSPEEGRAIATVYATAGLMCTMLLYGVAFAIGRASGREVA